MRKVLVLVAFVVMVVAAGIAVVVTNLDRYLNENKEWIAERVRTAVGRSVEFDSVEASFAGGLGIEVSDLTVADDPRFSGGDVLRVGSLLVRVRLWPALFGRIEVGRVILREPVLTVIRTEAGLNIDTMETSAGSDDTAKPSRGAALAIALVDVRDGVVHFVDRTENRRREITTQRIDFTATDVRPDAPVAFELRGGLMGAKGQNLHVRGSVGPLQAAAPRETPLRVDLEIDPLDLDALASTGLLPRNGASLAGVIRLETSAAGTLGAYDAELLVDATRASLEFGTAAKKPAGMPLRLELTAKPENGGLRIENGALTIDRTALGVEGVVGSDGASYDLQIDGDPIAMQALASLVPSLATLSTEGELTPKLRVQSTGGRPQIIGAITVSGLALQPPDAPRISGLSTTIEFRAGAVRALPASFDLGGSRARIEASVANLAKPELAFTLRSDRLQTASLGLKTGEDALYDLVARGSVELLGAEPRTEVHITSASGRLYGIDYSALDTMVHLEGSRVSLAPLAVRTFAGTIQAEGSYDRTRADDPEFHFESQIDGVDLGRVAAWVAPGAQHLLEGKINGKLSLAGAGKQWESIRQSIVGGGHVQLHEGTLRQINVADSVLKSITGIPSLSGLLSPSLRQRYPALFSAGGTAFQKLGGAFTIAQGRIITDDLSIKAQDFLIFGGGTVGLDQSVDVKATFEASPGLTRDLIAELDSARYLAGASGRLQVPFRLSGVLPGAKVQPDLSFVEQALQRALVDTLTGGILRPPQPSTGKPTSSGEPAPTPEPAPEPEQPAPPGPPRVEDIIKRSLEDLLGR